MFQGLKKKLSKRSSNPLTQKSNSNEANKSPTTQGGFLAPSNNNNNPFTSGTPPTRRPSSGANLFARHAANDPPPAYTPGPANQASMAYQAPIVASTDDDPYAFLRSFDTIFLIDDSGSMAGARWSQTQEALKLIAPICAERDEDGVDIYFLNNKKAWTNRRRAGDIIEIFQETDPGGQTYTGQRLWAILKPYLDEYKKNPSGTKPINVIVITDGDAHDDVSAPIQNAAKKLDEWDAPPWQVGIQFFQIGNDPQAREMLKQLDDELGGGKNSLRDIVDTVPFTSENGGQLSSTGIMKVVLGSVNRRLDRNSRELHR